MATRSNVPKDILDSIRDSLDRRIKLSIKRLVKYEVRPDKWENRVVAFSNNRLFLFTAKNPTKVENKFHYLDLHSIESPKPNKLTLTFCEKSYSFTTLESNTDEVDFMITHMCTSLKTVFPAISIERLIKKIDVQPSDRLRVMHDMVNSIEQKETGPCGGFTLMYDSMCEYHELPYRDEVAWDVDTIYLSQDSRELCLRDFDHLNTRDLIPIVSALLHNPWFTVLNANNVKLSPEVCTEILHVIQKNSVIESLQLSNTGINNDFLQKLSTSILSMSGTQLHKLDISNNPMLDDRGIIHLIGSLSSLGKGMTYLDLSKTKLSTKGIRAIAETMSKNSQVFSSLQTLILAELSSSKPEDLQMLYTFLAQPSMISHLDLSGTDCELERLMAPLQRGCSQSISFLKLSRTAFTNKRVKETIVPSSFKQFFSTVYSLKTLNLSGCKIPPEALKELLLGIGSNRNLSNVHLNLSSVDLNSQGIQSLQTSLSQLNNITSLNISNIVFNDQDLSGVLNSIGQTKTIKHLSIGRVFQKIKNLNMIMEELVHIIQDEESVIESLSLADSRLKSNMNQIINALGSNTSLTELDISGNSMGDLGARMLSKALQINNKLKTIMWDRNNTTAQGFEDIADALEKNYTLRKMPVPISDASQAARTQPERTEAALQAIERLLQRNHSPQKYSSDQAYRLQQGFLISSTQQMIDRLVVQSQDTINALSIDPSDSYANDIESTKALIKDADNSKMLLPKLHDIANKSQNPGGPVENKIKQISEELKVVLEQQMKKTVEQMIESTKQQCKAIMGDEVFLSALQAGCNKNSSLPKDFTSNILASVDNEIFNKLSELNLAVAAHVSDRILDEVIDRLSKSHKTLTNHLNIKKKNETRSSKTKSDRLNVDTADGSIKSNSPQSSPKVQEKRKSMLNRKLRPQSVIDRDRFAVNNDPSRPVTVPQTKRSPRLGSRSPKDTGSPKGSRSPKVKKSPKDKRSRTKQSVPDIEITYANVSGSIEPGKQREPIYDNAKNEIYMNVGKRGEVYRPEQEDRLETKVEEGESENESSNESDTEYVTDAENNADTENNTVPDDTEDIDDSLENHVEPETKVSKSVKLKKSGEEVDLLGDLPTLSTEGQKLTHLTASRPKVTNRANRTRPTTRKSQLPGTNDAVDEGLDNFFVSRSDEKTLTPVTKATPDSKKTAKADSNKSEPDSKKKHGLFGRKDSKEKEQKSGGLFGKLKKSGKTKESPKSPGRKLSQVGEEVDGGESVSLKSSDSGSQRSSSEKTRSNQSVNSVGKNQAGSEGDSSSMKSQDSNHSLNASVDKSQDLTETVKDEEAVEDRTESGTEEGTTEEELDETEESEEDKIEEKKPLQLPKYKRSFDKTNDSKKDAVSDSDKTVENGKQSEDEVDAKDKSEEVVNEGEEKKSESIEAKEEEPSPKLPAGVPRGIGGLPGLGGVNMMAELKAKQEKRKSLMPSGTKLPDKSPTQSSEEKTSPFGAFNLKSVADRKPKEKTENVTNNSETTVRPSSVKQGETTKSERPGSTSSTGESATEKQEGEKPSRPAAPPKRPMAPTRPKPPPVGNKPKPAPRRSRASEADEFADEADKMSDKTKTDDTKETEETKSPRTSVKDMIAGLRNSGGDQPGSPKQERPLSKTEGRLSSKTEGRPPSKTDSTKGSPVLKPKTEENKEESVKIDSKSESDQKAEADKSDQKAAEVKEDDSVKSVHSPEAGVIDLKTEENKEMTDSGIVYDSDTLKLSVKDKISRFGASKEDSDASPKSSSLTRGVKPSDIKDADTPKRPRSMFAVLQSNPALKKQESDSPRGVTPKVLEEDKEDDKGAGSPTEEIVMV